MKAALWLGICVGAATATAWGLIAVARVADWAGIKRTFYSVLIAAMFFYTARAVRAVARYFEAKARKEAL